MSNLNAIHFETNSLKNILLFCKLRSFYFKIETKAQPLLVLKLKAFFLNDLALRPGKIS